MVGRSEHGNLEAMFELLAPNLRDLTDPEPELARQELCDLPVEGLFSRPMIVLLDLQRILP